MRVYFDTNVYIASAERGDAARLRSVLDGAGIQVIASYDNIVEASRAPTVRDRVARMRAMTKIASKLEDLPLSHIEAQELLKEMRRCRPKWVRTRSAAASVKQHLRGRKSTWRDLQSNAAMDFSKGLEAYTPVAERGIQTYLTVQYSNRDEFRGKHEILQGQTLASLDPLFRASSMHVWANALNGEPAMRDYADWLLPYLRPVAISGLDWQVFWNDEVRPSAMPQNRCRCVVEFLQSFYKISHGNALDLEHAGYALHCAVLVTADKAFFMTVKRLQAIWTVSKIARPVLMDRASPSAATAIVRAIREGEV